MKPLDKKFFVFYYNYNEDQKKADNLITNGLGWHGREWWFSHGHDNNNTVIESEELDKDDMDDGIPRTKVAISFHTLTLDELERLSKQYCIPQHLIDEALKYLINPTSEFQQYLQYRNLTSDYESFEKQFQKLMNL
jgi:hypothetical protein